MCKQNIQLSQLIRDCLLTKMEIFFEYYLNDEYNQSDCLSLYFTRPNNSHFRVSLFSLLNINLFINRISGEYIESLKCIETSNSIVLCLDPYDERILEITSQDNMTIEFKRYTIEEI